MTDNCSTLLFYPTKGAVKHVVAERITGGVYRVGVTMFDAVRLFTARAENQTRISYDLGVVPKAYYLAIKYWPYTTDDPKRLSAVVEAVGMYLHEQDLRTTARPSAH